MTSERVSVRWPGQAGVVRAERRLLPGGIVVLLRKTARGIEWIRTSATGTVSGRADNQAAAMRAAVFAGGVA